MNINTCHCVFQFCLNESEIMICPKMVNIANEMKLIDMQISNKPDYKMKIAYFWKPLLWLAIICYALFIPAGDLPIKPFLKIPHFDKMVHFGLFFVFCLFTVTTFKKTPA
jgi:hypothetical protein